ncbi:MAG: hypothetical protein HZB82_05110 [Deltaproteobacteria bacterium]|nr:hypothetical protein [Deltaproteobacteria bacterium]
MGRTEESESLRKLFLEKLRETGCSVDTSLKFGNSEVYRILKMGRQWIIFLKISTAKHGKGFWGVTKTLFDIFTLYEKKSKFQNIKNEDIKDEDTRKFLEELKKILTGPDEQLLIVLLQPWTEPLE